jgi:hypothetical protein
MTNFLVIVVREQYISGPEGVTAGVWERERTRWKSVTTNTTAEARSGRYCQVHDDRHATAPL